MNANVEIVKSSGNKNKTGVVDNISVLEQKLAKGISEKQKPYHYDELCRFGKAGFVYNRVKPVHDDEGQIDVFQTFMKARKRNPAFGGF